MSTEVGSAFVSVVPSARGFGSRLSREVDGPVAAAGQRSGSRFGAGFLTASKLVGAAIVGTVVSAGTVGLRVAAQMEQAEISFTTMLGSGRKARAFLGDLEAFAAKTPFEFPELQTAASSLVSAGIKAKNVIPIMTTLGDVTSGMGTGSEGIKRATIALQQMQAAGKITGEDLNQLRDAGIPVYDLLASATNRSKAEVVALAQAGKLGKEDLKAMMGALKSGDGLERFTGLMAKQSASLTGMWSTLKDTFSVGMADAIQPLLPLIKEGLGGATAFLAAKLPLLGAGLASVVVHVRSWFDAQNGGAGFDIGAMFDKVQVAAAKLWPQIQAGARELKGIGPIVSVTGAVFGFFAGHLDTLIKYMPLIVAGFIAVKVAQAAGNVVALARLPIEVANTAALLASASANRALAAQMAIANSVEKVSIVTRLRATAATVAHTVVSKTAAVAAKAWAATQWLLNAALTANPIGLVVVAIAALVAGLVIAYRRSETFRDIVNGVFRAVLGAASAFGEVVAEVFGQVVGDITRVVKFFLGIEAKIRGALTGAGTWLLDIGKDIVQGLIDGVQAGFGKVKEKFNQLTNLIPDWKGPRQKDKTLLTPAGRTIIDGLIKGFDDRKAKVRDVLDAITEMVKSRVDKLADLKKQALDLASSAGDSVRGMIDVGAIGAAITTTDAEGVETSRTPSVAETFAGFASQAASFAQSITTMAARGLAPALVAALALSGNVTAANALATASEAELASVKVSSEAISAAAQAVGNTILTTSPLPAQIAREEAFITEMRGMREELARRPDTVIMLDRQVLARAMDAEKRSSARRGTRK